MNISFSLSEILQSLNLGEHLDAATAEFLFTEILNGKILDADLAVILTRMAERGETVTEVAAAAKVLRAHARTITPVSSLTMDCCGTGGDSLHTFNISTAVSFVVAASGVPVAKHGNRSVSSKSGTADVMEALGIKILQDPAQSTNALETLGICFLMAPNYHTAMRHVVTVRKSLGIRTIFNLLGPLANPAGVKRQLLGVYDNRWVRPLAEVLADLGSDKAWVVHGTDGLDELSVAGENHVAILDNGTIREVTISPKDAGLPEYTTDDLKGGTPDDNAKALLDIFTTPATTDFAAYRDCVLFNAAACLIIADLADTLTDGARIARQALLSGTALRKLQDFRDFTLKTSEESIL